MGGACGHPRWRGNDPALRQGLEPVIVQWRRLLANYSDLDGGIAYDHSENANTGFLVAAANAVPGMTGMVEHWTERARAEDAPGTADKRKTGRGLLDAYIATDDTGYCLELKQCWLRKGKGDRLVFSGSDRLKQARTQIETIRDAGFFQAGHRFLYGGFLVPDLPEEPGKRPTQARVVEWLGAFCEEQDLDVHAIFAPDLKRGAMKSGPGNGFFRPCVALGLKELV